MAKQNKGTAKQLQSAAAQRPTPDFGFEWKEFINDDGYSVAAICFPHRTYSSGTYGLLVYLDGLDERKGRYRTRRLPLRDVPTAEGICNLVSVTLHPYDTFSELGLLNRTYPEQFPKGLEAFERLVDARATTDLLQSTYGDRNAPYIPNNDFLRELEKDPQESNYSRHYSFGGEQYSVQGIRQQMISSKVIDGMVKIAMKYEVPIGTLTRGVNSDEPARPVELSDYMDSPSLMKAYAHLAPSIGTEYRRIEAEVKRDPAMAIKKVLSNLPSYNAGKTAHYLAKAIAKNKKVLDRKELTAIVDSAPHIGLYDKEPFYEVFENVWGSK